MELRRFYIYTPWLCYIKKNTGVVQKFNSEGDTAQGSGHR